MEMSMPVTLIVKAPNQQIEDQTIQCELDWSIKRLKGHLSEVYPSKPKTEDQKLIYLGQLLNDANVLKDILRCYNEGQENHTVHLVCSPPKESFKNHKPVASKPASNSQSNQRLGESTSMNPPSTEAPIEPRIPNLRSRHNAAASQPNIQSPVGFNNNDPRTTWANMPTSYVSTAAQQAILMQQIYAQYMTQYFQMVSANGMYPNALPYPGANIPLQQPNPVQAPERNEPINQAPRAGADEEGRGNRDWLEWFYVSSRLLILFCILYFYSSPLRFFLVSTLGLLLYLYQIGFFRQIALENNNEPGAVAPTRVPPGDGGSDEGTGEARPARPSLLTMTWTIVSSFFLSLIPEQPNML